MISSIRTIQLTLSRCNLTLLRSIHSQWHGVARRHLNHLDYLDRIDRGLSSWSRSDSNVGAAARKTHVLHEQRHDGIGLGVPHEGRTKSLKSSGTIGRADLTDDFRFSFLETEASFPDAALPSVARRVVEIPAVERFDKSRTIWSIAFTWTCAEIEILLD